MRRSEVGEFSTQVDTPPGNRWRFCFTLFVVNDEQLAALDLDRWTVMRVLRAERFSFAAMIPVLVSLGLLECSKEHRFRVRTEKGDSVCVTCETNLGNYWRRGLVKMGEVTFDPKEVKGAWLEDHEFIMRLCRENAVGPATDSTTRTTETVEVIDGKEVKTIHTVRNVREFRVINAGLLRLLSDVRDKMARVGGFNVATADADPTPAPELHFHELDDDGAGAKPN